MTRFLEKSLSREEFLEWMARDSAEQLNLPTAESFRDPNRYDVTLVWESVEEGSRNHPLIVVPANAMEDFFAFTSTYITTHRPYSAFYRVVPRELLNEIKNRHALSEAADRFAKVAAGAALSEHYLRSRERAGSVPSSVLVSLRSTLSVILGKGIASGYSSVVVNWIADQWDSVHPSARFAGRPSRDIVVSIWMLLLGAARGEMHRSDSSYVQITQFLSTALRNEAVSVEMLASLGAKLPILVDPVRALRAPREERILLFNKFVSGIDRSGSDELLSSFVAGLLLAIAGNGSFDMLRSARDLAERAPSAIIWFGVCAALFQESNVLTVGSSVGRRLVRDFLAPRAISEGPRADLSLFEYKMLLRDATNLEQLNTESVDAYCLEVLPDVVTYISRDVKGPNVRSRDELQNVALGLQEIRHIIDRVQHRLGLSAEPSQQELFRPDRRPRNKPR
ncbi:hypothetical protein [Bradyrhizobium sp. LB13.1]